MLTWLFVASSQTTMASLIIFRGLALKNLGPLKLVIPDWIGPETSNDLE
jgi:hypothetical protein